MYGNKIVSKLYLTFPRFNFHWATSLELIVVIKELSLNLQNKIKETIKKSADLEVKEVNVKVNNIAQPKK